MKKSLLKEYEIVLERLENVDLVTKRMVFKVLSLEDKDTLQEVINMSDEELKELLSN